MSEFNEKYTLNGKLLVAMPSLDKSGLFERSVVYICSHERNGVMGIVVNKRLDKYTFSDLSFLLPVRNYKKLSEVNLYTGGPLEQVRGMVLHSTDYMRDDSLLIGKGIAISASTEIITDIAFDRGPENKLVALGYSFWRPGQLEDEIYNNDWMVVEADKTLLFDTPDAEKWEKSMDISGIALDRFVHTLGHG